MHHRAISFARSSVHLYQYGRALISGAGQEEERGSPADGIVGYSGKNRRSGQRIYGVFDRPGSVCIKCNKKRRFKHSDLIPN